MNYLKKNKFTIIAIILFVSLVIVGVKLKNILVPDEGKAVYGNRLDNIDKHQIAKNVFEEMETGLKENTKITSVSEKVHGKIINLMITVTDDTTIQDGKAIANSTIEYFKNGELDYYSLNVYVQKVNKELNNFPIEGYKNPTSKELIFTKDRDISSGENHE